MFAGQGAQHPGMGLALSQSSPAAAKVFDDADRILGWKLSELCFQGPQEELTACAHCQPAIFVTSLAALAARRETPSAEEEFVMAGGLSLGEVTAVTAAGMVDFEHGLKMVARRGELMDECCRRTRGAMLAVIGAPDEALEEVCRNHGIQVANFNCPGQRILSGEKNAVEAAAKDLEGVAMKTQLLEVAGAYHSPLMQEAAEAFREFLTDIPFGAPKMPLVHNVLGGSCEDSRAQIVDLLSRQIVSPVRWEDCARAMMGAVDALWELGPGHVLCGLARRIDRRFPAQASDL